MDSDSLLDAVLGLTALLSTPDPFAHGADICALLAAIGDARGLAIFGLEVTGEAQLLGAAGLPADYLRRYPPDTLITRARLPGDLRECARRGAPLQVVGLTSDPRTVSLSSVANEGRFESTLCIPLIYDDRMLGLLHVFYGARHRPEQQQLLARVALQVGATMARTHLSALGGSTGLLGVTLVDRQLKHTHAAAERYSQPYTVAVYTMDGAEAVIRRFGTGLIQEAMDSLSELINVEARDCDLIGYGGATSFMVIMPGTTQKGGFSQCSRVLEQFGLRSFKVEGRRVQLSASAGISCYPENGARSGEASASSARAALAKAIGETGRRIVAIAARGAAIEVGVGTG